ncbi:MAG TPA: type II toxin-antitoxin system VapC family toxin [Terracidiphilus sp.]|jgi:hypothetical protein
MYLLDTNIVSELRKNKPNGAVSAWFDSVPAAEIRVSAVVMGELQAGVERTRRQDPQKAVDIEHWIDRIGNTFAVVTMDGDAFREWARLMAATPDDLSVDAMIAATARIHSLTVVTRNVKDFTTFSVPILNPFDGMSYLPSA